MMDRVSMTAREYRGGRSGLRRDRYDAISDRLWKRQPVASDTSSMPRPAQSRPSSASRSRIVSGPISSANNAPRSRKAMGCDEQMSAASRTRLASSVFMSFRYSYSLGRIAGRQSSRLERGGSGSNSACRSSGGTLGCERVSMVLSNALGLHGSARRLFASKSTTAIVANRGRSGLAADHPLPWPGQIVGQGRDEGQRLAARRVDEAKLGGVQRLALDAQRGPSAIEPVSHQRPSTR